MSTPVLPDYQAPFKPVPNVTPFTIRDGMTMLKKVDYINKYLERVLLPWVQKNFNDLADAFELQVNLLIAQFNNTLNEQTEAVDAKIDELEEFVNQQVQLIIESGIAVSDPVIYGVISDVETDSRTLLDRNYAKVENVYTEAEIVDAIGRIVANGGGKLCIPAGVTINLTETIHLPDEVTEVVIDGDIVQTANVSVFTRFGSVTDTIYLVTEDVLAGQRTVEATPTTNLAQGDLVLIASTDVLSGTADKIGYLRYIRSINGEMVTFDTAIPRNMVDGANRRFRKINRAAPIRISGSGTVSYQNHASKTANMVVFRYVDGVDITGVKFFNGGSRCIQLQHCINFYINARIHNFVDDVENMHVGYGVDACGATRDGIVEGTISKVRHAFTTNVGPSLPEFGYYGEPENIVVRPVTAYCTDKALDTHRAGWGIVFEACDTGSGGVVQVRADNTIIRSVNGNGNYGSYAIVIGSVVQVPPVIGHVNISYSDNPAIHALAPAILTALPRRIGGAGTTFSSESVPITVVPEVMIKARTTHNVINNEDEFVEDDVIRFNVEKNARYLFEAFVVYRTGATPDITFGWGFPTNTVIQWSPDGLDTTVTNPTGSIRRAVLYQTDVATVGGAGAAQDTLVRLTGRIVTGDTAGEVVLKFRQSTADASDTQLRTGTHIRVERYQ